MNTPVAQAAVLPFQILESEGIPCGYERSAKLIRGNILANRYLLGINLSDIKPEQLKRLCTQLDMPPGLERSFQAGLVDANLVFIGFEADARGSGLYKLYLENWDQLREQPGFPAIKQDRFLLHRGFKWHIEQPERQAVTDYHFIPGLDTEQVLDRIGMDHVGLRDPVLAQAVTDIIKTAQQGSPERQFIYVEVSEPGNARLSFDLNLYPAGLQVQDIQVQLQRLAEHLQIEADKFERLMQICTSRSLGHISAGTARDDQPYFTFYYEC